MSVFYVILLSWLSVCEKLSNSVEIWPSSDKQVGSFFWPTLYKQACLVIGLLMWNYLLPFVSDSKLIQNYFIKCASGITQHSGHFKSPTLIN